VAPPVQCHARRGHRLQQEEQAMRFGAGIIIGILIGIILVIYLVARVLF
jgi:tetrahydromethanopterin S-methyltransferase subunit F